MGAPLSINFKRGDVHLCARTESLNLSEKLLEVKPTEFLLKYLRDGDEVEVCTQDFRFKTVAKLKGSKLYLKIPEVIEWGEERRKTLRVRTEGEVLVILNFKERGRYELKTLDLSTGGFSVITQNLSLVELCLNLRQTQAILNLKGKPFALNSQLRNIYQMEGNHYRLGFMFLNTPIEISLILWDYISQRALKSLL